MKTNDNQWDKLLLTLVFLLVLFLPDITSYLHISPTVLPFENRNLAQMPLLKFDRSMMSFPSKFQDYFNDHFGFRGVLISWEHTYKNKLLNVLIKKGKFTLGKDGWIFLMKRIPFPFTDHELATIKNNIKDRESFFARKGICFFLVFVPDPESIYPEYLPDPLQPTKDINKYDQLYAYLRSDPLEKVIIDLKKVMIKNKEFILPQPWIDKFSLTTRTAKIYYKTDIHWNYLGAYLGYNEILDHLKVYYPWIEPVPLSSFEIRPGNMSHGRRITQWLPLGKSNYQQGYILTLPDNYYLSKWPEIKKTAGFHQLNLLIVGDSLVRFYLLDWFKAPLFKVSYLYKNTKQDMVLSKIAIDKPDIIIYESSERGIDNLSFDHYDTALEEK